MDPPNDDSPGSEDEAAAMAAAMGFSSFGSTERPSKKRRFNSHADAVVSGTLPAAPGSLPARPPQPARLTGANNLPLHPRGPPRGRGQPAQGSGNADEIDLGGDDESDGGADASADVPRDGTAEDGDDRAPQYIDTSREPGAYEDLGGSSEPQGQEWAGAGGPGAPERGGFRHRGGRGGGRGGYAASGRSQWWLDYYDPSSNENPWQRLEQSRGIESKGEWLTRASAVAASVTAS